MKNNKMMSASLSILVFMLIALTVIIMTDLFVFGGIQKVIDSNKAKLHMDNSVDVAALYYKHNHYMENGIDIDNDIDMARKTLPPPYFDDNKVEISNYDNDSAENISIEDLLAKDKDSDIANIEPAAGIAGDLKASFSSKKNKPLIDDFPEILEAKPASVDVLNKDEGKQVISNVVENILQEPQVKTSPVYEYIEPKGAGMVAIIIDDMGISLRSKQVEAMPYPLTLSYLPYAKNLNERTKSAAASGHEIMLHMPMEAMNKNLDGGPKVLKGSLSDDDFIKVLDWDLSSFEGFVGFNNHMGSRLTQNRDAMQRIMDHIKGKNLFFIDSKTISSSVAASVARDNGIPYAERDVFIDHKVSMDFTRKSLAKLENIAKKRGYAIAIGHPHKETIAVLKEWLPTLAEKGITLVPVSKVVKYPKKVAMNGVVSAVAN